MTRWAHITPSPLFHLQPPVVSGPQIFAAVQSAIRGRAEIALLPPAATNLPNTTAPPCLRVLSFSPHLSLSSFTCTHLVTAQASVYSIATSFAQCLFFRKVISLVSQTSRISFLVWSRLVSPVFQEKKKLSFSSVANYSFVVELRPSSS